MSYADTVSALKSKRDALLALHDEIRELQKTVEPQPVQDYVFEGWSGPVRLSELFARKRDLFVIHNMGTSCRYCTMWADGFNGVYEHLADRAAFVLATPNTPDVQKQFARSRGWRFPMVSHAGNSFAKDMGYRLERGDEIGEDNSRWVPGVSAFQLARRPRAARLRRRARSQRRLLRRLALPRHAARRPQRLGAEVPLRLAAALHPHGVSGQAAKRRLSGMTRSWRLAPRSASARPVSIRLFRLARMLGQPLETAPISLELATSIAWVTVSLVTVSEAGSSSNVQVDSPSARMAASCSCSQVTSRRFGGSLASTLPVSQARPSGPTIS